MLYEAWGKKKTLTEWSRTTGTPYKTLHWRLGRAAKDPDKWPPERVFTGPLDQRRRAKKAEEKEDTEASKRKVSTYTVRGQTLTVKEWSRVLGVSTAALYMKLKRREKNPRKWPLERVFAFPDWEHVMVTFNKVTRSVASWAENLNFSTDELAEMLARGIPLRKALSVLEAERAPHKIVGTLHGVQCVCMLREGAEVGFTDMGTVRPAISSDPKPREKAVRDSYWVTDPLGRQRILCDITMTYHHPSGERVLHESRSLGHD